jgi:fermentation-respiration switch protein FrsA (DUF1100 family)
MRAIVKKSSRFLLQILIAAIVAIIFWTILAMIFEEKFIFFPEKYPSGLYNESSRIPNLVDCWVIAEDGIKIHGWFAPNDSAIATLVIAHGNAGNLSHRIDIIRALQKVGFNVMMFDYRGYGRSEGAPSENGIYKDGRAAFDYVCKLPKVDTDRIILWGTSLGGAVAIDVAIHRKAAGLILEATFTSAKDFAAVHYSFLPIRYLLKSEFNSIDKIPGIHIPLLMIHGTQDGIVPIRLGKELFAAANEPKEFYEIANADHNDTYFIGGVRYFGRVRDFVLNNISSRSH